MAQIIIRGLDDGIKAQLAAQAANRGFSMEEHARHVIETAVRSDSASIGMGTAIHRFFEGCHLDSPLELPPKDSPDTDGVNFDDHS